MFKRDPTGRHEVVAANVNVEAPNRRWRGAECLPHQPQRPSTSSRPRRFARRPPKQPDNLRPMDLAELHALHPSIRLDIRYASTDNFLGTPIYKQPRAFLQRPAAEALVRAHRALAKQGLGLLIHDGYRPWYVTKVFWDATPARARSSSPTRPRVRGTTALCGDLTLYSLSDGKPSRWWAYTTRCRAARPELPGGTSLQRYYRRVLRDAMEGEGFNVYEWEWWHFDYKDWAQYPVGNVTFESIGKTNDAPVPASPPSKTPIAFEKRDVMIPMRDGVKLHTEIYTPKDAGSLPVILTRTPYGISTATRDAPHHRGLLPRRADDGYSLRLPGHPGTEQSEGSFVMLRNPGRAAIQSHRREHRHVRHRRLLLKNTKTSGRVGMLGVSYGGWLTVMAMLDPHPAMKPCRPRRPG